MSLHLILRLRDMNQSVSQQNTLSYNLCHFFKVIPGSMAFMCPSSAFMNAKLWQKTIYYLPFNILLKKRIFPRKFDESTRIYLRKIALNSARSNQVRNESRQFLKYRASGVNQLFALCAWILERGSQGLKTNQIYFYLKLQYLLRSWREKSQYWLTPSYNTH